MAGMRDKMIHEYFGVDIEILWKTIKEDIPPIEPLVRKVLEDFGNIFDRVPYILEKVTVVSIFHI